MATIQNENWLSVKQLAEEFGIAMSTQAKYRKLRIIPFSKIGGFIFYSRDKINEWLMRHTFEAEGALR